MLIYCNPHSNSVISEILVSSFQLFCDDEFVYSIFKVRITIFINKKIIAILYLNPSSEQIIHSIFFS